MSDETSSKLQRNLLLVAAVSLLLWGGFREAFSDRLGQSVSNAALLRVGFVLLACWVALPVIRRPAAWLPPGATAVVVILIGAAVFQPKLLLVLIPLFSSLLALGAFIRFFRSS
ncbi:hypothetical protein Poly24_13040 [Rosistilla carotiformis]|uniref:Uncharacterized protein n=1 Tax=Rosistilla carotiformis TaxID=2528017 RepID=A0A518JPY9_9BACT|nr:hypothetical protein [Rosistilla carotiformis]QDV67603.1 hypothetical protein Poly24_13040 [Rosistilla carotiformis]